MLTDMVFWSLAAGMGSLPSLCSTAPGERRRSQQSSQTGEIRTLTHHQWEFKGGRMSTGWGILKSFPEEGNGIGWEDLGRENTSHL